jgi:WD40 repeat protein
MGALTRSVDILNGTNGDQQQQSMLVSGSADKTIKMWNIKSGQLLNTISTGLTITHLSVLNIYKKFTTGK